MAMTNEDIIQMAREAGIPEMAIEGVFIANSDDLGRLIAAEREACALILDNCEMERTYTHEMAKMIRARGQND